MKGVLYIRNKDGEFIPIPAIKGEKGDKGDAGESVYSVATANGYGGLEEDFNSALASLTEIQWAANTAFSNAKAALSGIDNITPENIGAVKKSGDTVNGNLNVNGALAVERTDSNRKARTVAHNNADKEVDFQNYGDDANYVSVRVETEAKGIGDAVKVTQMKDGQFSSFTLLHTGNKEKIFTFGAEDLTAGSTPLGNGQLHFTYE